jgi:hypothetical protein
VVVEDEAVKDWVFGMLSSLLGPELPDYLSQNNPVARYFASVVQQT